MFEQCRHAVVAVGVDPAVRQTVALCVLAQTHRRGRERGADDLQGRGRRVQQGRASGEECLEHGVAEPGIGQHLRSEGVRRDDDDVAGSGDAARQIGPLAGDEADLAQKAARSVRDDHLTV